MNSFRRIAALLAAAALAGCAARPVVRLPAPPAEVRREPAAAPAPPADNVASAPAPGAAAPPDRQTAYRDAIRRTKEAMARGAGREALAAWQALEESPYGTDAVFHQGVLLHQAGDLDAAVAQYGRLVRGPAPHEAAAANLLGIYLLRGEIDAARALADRILPGGAAPPPSMRPELAANIACVRIEQGDPDRAALILLALKARGAATPALPWNMAVVAWRRGDFDAAKRLAAGLPPEIGALWPVAASRYAFDRDPAKIPALDNVPRSERRMEALSRNLAAWSEYLKGDAEGAARALAPPAGGKNPLPQLDANLGAMLAESGRWREARAVLERAVRDAPGAPEGWLNLGLFREVYEGNSGAALECYENYVKLGGSRSAEVLKWVEWLRKSR